MKSLFIALAGLLTSQVSLAKDELKVEMSCRGYISDIADLFVKTSPTRSGRSYSDMPVHIDVLAPTDRLDAFFAPWEVRISLGMTGEEKYIQIGSLNRFSQQTQMFLSAREPYMIGDRQLYEFRFMFDITKPVKHKDGTEAYSAVAYSDIGGSLNTNRIERNQWEYFSLSCVEGEWKTEWKEKDDYKFKNELRKEDLYDQNNEPDTVNNK